MNGFYRAEPEVPLRRNLIKPLYGDVSNIPQPNIPTRRSFDRPLLKKHDSVMNFKKILSENTDEFCKHSTLHGLKYVVDEQVYPPERIFFAISFVGVVFLSVFFISNVYSKWRSTPVIVGINPEPSYILNEPFPALTFCNLNQASKKKAQLYDVDSDEYTMLQSLCSQEINRTIADSINWNNFEEFIVNISQPCEEMLVGCSFGAVEYKCNQLFRSIVTDEGQCCAFNMLDPNLMYNTQVSKYRNQTNHDTAQPINWNPESGYPKDLPEYYYPRRAMGSGQTLGLSLTLDINLADYYCSSAASVGIKLALHSPAEIPHVGEIGALLPAGSETKIHIRTHKTEADRNLKSIAKQYRQCLFNGEETLEYFSYYNRHNCEMECQARRLLDKCQCLKYYMPTIKSEARICGIKDTRCVENFLHKQFKSHALVEDCQHKCWPSCFDLNFHTDFFSAPISNDGFSVANKFVGNKTSKYVERNLVVVHFFFTENTFRSTKQTEFIGMTDFLSSVGGLMGLFMGFSLISIAEFIYYAILRPYHLMKRRDRLRRDSVKSYQNSQNHSLRFMRAPKLYIRNQLTRSSKLQQFPVKIIEHTNNDNFVKFNKRQLY